MPLQRGRVIAKTPRISNIRTLSRADLPLLLEKRPKPTIKSLSDKHHRLARAVASGLPTTEIAAICGITTTRISMLKSDPAFIELIAHYRGMVTADYIRSADSYLEIATANMIKAEAMLGDKLDAAIDNDELLPTRDLIAISRDAADRFGYGKTQKNLNVNVDFAAQLEAARKRSTQVREIGPSSAQSAPTLLTSPPEAPVSEPTPFRRRI